jgi:hypothetical protein
MVIKLKMWICNKKHWILDNKEDLIHTIGYHL